jgi:hypothetical protein
VKGVALQLELPKGKYEGEWLDAVSGKRIMIPVLDHQGGVALLRAPEWENDGALRLIVRAEKGKQ